MIELWRSKMGPGAEVEVEVVIAIEGEEILVVEVEVHAGAVGGMAHWLSYSQTTVAGEARYRNA